MRGGDGWQMERRTLFPSTREQRKNRKEYEQLAALPPVPPAVESGT
nr:MAG TPA: hypothetical protein [Caudoviricetes sp.]